MRIVYLLTCCYCFFSFSVCLEAAVLHAVIVTDTLDPTIGQSTQQDAKMIQEEVRRIAEATDLTLQEHLFSGKTYRIRKIQDCIEGLKVAEEDVIFYYHAGHGIERSMGLLDPFPLLKFDSDNAFSVFELVAALQEKAPRFCFLLIDACNQRVDDRTTQDKTTPPEELKPAEESAPFCTKQVSKEEKPPVSQEETLTELEKLSYRKLFLEPKGRVILLAASAGCSAFSSEKYGGIATFIWQKMLRSAYLRSEQSTWKQLLSRSSSLVYRTTRKCPDGARAPQRMWYSIDLDTEPSFTTP